MTFPSVLGGSNHTMRTHVVGVASDPLFVVEIENARERIEVVL